MAKEYKDLVVGLDIGTAKVMVVVAEVLPGGELKLAGMGVAPSNGLRSEELTSELQSQR